ncbi:MAG TPA: DUF5009 domain-containing protein [Caldithrix abyssi]|uniref:DUF5009 domain-containing protein n=1 Tax=Caldithrix abyssi TaxID=187145 RepID=A0A7V1LP55_CALAY|nr:DUF5009 domain-containing protein [Caldithrix abyssi]
MTKVKERLKALDVLRGATIAAMILVNNPGSWSHIYPPLEHAAWHGWTFTDLIFPFFLFVVGVSIVLALQSKIEDPTQHRALYKKIIRRTLILFGLGLFLSGFPFFNLSTLRIPGVLQRIAVCYFFAALLFIHLRRKGLWTVTLVLLFGYWALMAWYPVPGTGAGSLEKGANFAAWIDQMVLSGHMWSATKTWDPEGIVSTLPAIATTLFGVFTGMLFKSTLSTEEKTIRLFVYGNGMIFVGLVWNLWLPINKNLWTSSYAVFMSGMAMVILGILTWWIDIRKQTRFTKPFIVYGMNAITVFVLSGLIGRLLYIIRWQDGSGTEVTLKGWIYHLLFTPWLSPVNASLAYALTWVALSYAAMHWMYKRGVFLKV